MFTFNASFGQKLAVAKMLRQQKMVTFFNAVTHSRVASASRQAVAIKARVCFLLVCDHSILACIVLVQ
jgi:hypothetical protein